MLYKQLGVSWDAQSSIFVDMTGDYMVVHFMQNSLSCIFMFYVLF